MYTDERQKGRNNADGISKEKARYMAKRYLLAKVPIWYWPVFIIGILFVLNISIMSFSDKKYVLGLIVVILGAGALFLLHRWKKNRLDNELAGERIYDKVLAYEIELAKREATSKFNVIDEQVMNVEPVSINGVAAYVPVTSDDAGRKGWKSIKKAFIIFFTGIFAIPILLYNKLKKKNKGSNEPVFIYKINYEGEFRCSLVEVTTFLFGEEQLFIYYKNLDITTGLSFNEATHELFYKDIVGIGFEKKWTKYFNAQRKEFKDRYIEYVKITTTGEVFRSGISTTTDRSLIDEQFAGMRSLIREAKNS